jgi:hypothetical protein
LADTLLMPSGPGASKVLDKIRKQYMDRGPGPGRARFVLWGLTILVAAAAVTWTVRDGRALSPTYDEPHHLATGLDWWQFHSSRWWTENPPLPKVVTSLGPYLAGLRLPDREQDTWDPRGPGNDPWTLGNTLLYRDGGDPQRWLRLARLGNLPFLLLTLLLTFLLAQGPRRPWAGLVATALVATYPPLLGHAALATTDVATVATTLLFLYCLDAWWRRRRLHRAGMVGAAFGLALLCKLTAPLLCGAVAVGWLVGRRLTRKLEAEAQRSPSLPPTSTKRAAVPRSVRKPVAWPRQRPARAGDGHPVLFAGLTALCGLLATFVVVWAGYRFSMGRVDDLSPVGFFRDPILPAVADRPTWLAWLCQLRLPAPEVPHGYLFLKSHNSHGHLAYLFGNVSDHGFWNFYLVGLLLKSPLPFLVLVVLAMMVFVRMAGRAGRIAPTAPAVGLASLAALALSTAGTINIGLRHFLAIVPLVAVWIAAAIDVLMEATPPRGLRPLAVAGIGLLLAGQAVIVERAEPELMAYFNPLAGHEPGAALIDSDLDWGQDFAFLKGELAMRKIPEVRIALFSSVRPCGPDMPTLRPLVPRQPETGWIVISENYYRAPDLIGLRRDPCDPSTAYGFHEAPPDGFAWLRAHTPVARIGASLRLYHIDEPPPPAASSESESETATAPPKVPARPHPKAKDRTGRRGLSDHGAVE